MKRILFLLIFLLSFSLCCCSLLSGLLGTSSNEKVIETDVPVNTKGEVYLVKLNMSQKIIKGENTGYVSGVSSRAAAESGNSYYANEAFLRDINNQITQGVNNYYASGARAAASQSSVVTGYSTKTYGTTEKFWSYVDTKTERTLLGGTQEGNIPGQLTTTKKYEGKHCYVYADNKNSNSVSKGISLSDADYKALGEKFDSCYELETSVLGNPLYQKYNSDFFVPCNQKIVILVSDLFGDATEDQESGTVGYFYSGDLYNQTFLDETAGLNKGKTYSDNDYIHSNSCEMFYIDALFFSKLPETVYSTLVHEFNHMINYVIKTVNYMTQKTSATSLRACDTWFTEMLAMTTEDMFQKYLGIDDQHSPKARLPNFGMAYYYGFKNWDDKNVNPLIFYANTYAFGAFLARNFGGIDLIKEIAQNDYVNEQAITKALQKVNPNYKDLYTGKTVELDLDYAVRRFSACVVFTEEGDDYTLNKGTAFTKEGLGFDKLNISTKIDYEGTVYNVPLTFKKEAKLDIYPTGFTVHYVGYNISGFKLAASNNEYLEYYLVTK